MTIGGSLWGCLLRVPDLNLLLSRYVRLAEFTPDAESSRPLDARRDSSLWLMRSAKILFNAVNVQMCSKSPSKYAVVREGPRLLALTLFVARSTLAVERFAIRRLREIQTSREERRRAVTGYSMPSKIR